MEGLAQYSDRGSCDWRVGYLRTHSFYYQPIPFCTGLRYTPCPERKRLSWAHVLRDVWHPGGELVKLETHGFKEFGSGGSSSPG